MSILDRFRLDGKVAIVTGASGGLGQAFALALGQTGANIALAGRRADRLHDQRAELAEHGIVSIPVPTDVADPSSCANLVAETVAQLGRVDVLVNNAGVATAVPASREAPEEFRRVIDVNLNGWYWMAQAAAREMSHGGSIINVASILALTSAGLPQAAYSASKAGLGGLTRDLAQQWTGRKGIRVNALAPGFFPSEMTADLPDGYLDAQVDRTLAGRLGEPEELAAAVLYLASDASSYVTGSTLTVDGGFTVL
jgi:NAD(P)-dependent dehydrogenase (short-subunit alcohol dehydrogenase family)